MPKPEINKYYFHRKYGVCQLIDIINPKKADEKYVVKIVYDTELQVTFPSGYFDKAVRELMSKEEIIAILEQTRNEELKTEQKPNARIMALKKMMAEGEFAVSASIMKNILEFRENGSISFNDQKLMDSLEKFVFGEIAFVLGMDYDSAKEYFIETVIK